MENTDPQLKLLPVQVNLAALHVGNRADTLVFWVLPTESLKNILKPVTDISGYLQTCP